MAIRTSADKVRQIIDGCDEIAMEPFIEAASVIVDYLVSTCSRMAALTDANLELVERWLAAHYYAQRDAQYTSKSTGGSSASFQGQVGMYFESTWWGQRAMELDMSGCLANRNEELKTGRKVASLTWLGKTKTERLDAWERD